WEHSGIVEERIYLGGFEIYRRRELGDIVLERQTLHIMDDTRRITMVETKTIDTAADPFTVTPRIRYQCSNHLGSAILELDGDGLVISYEEYHPYGTSAYRAVDDSIEVSARRYRYTGKERDEETGLSYHGARYYACWLGRWTSADPAGMVDGPNLFQYVRGRPLTHWDPAGYDATAIAVTAARAALTAVGTDVATPEPTDLAPQKWLVYGGILIVAGAILYFAPSPVKPRPIAEAPPKQDPRVDPRPSPTTDTGPKSQPKPQTYDPLPEPPTDKNDKPRETVNLGRSAIVAATSTWDPKMTAAVQAYLADKDLVVTKAGLEEFTTGSLKAAGPIERKMVEALLARTKVIPNDPSDRVLVLKLRRKTR
ncbi:MAG TPA: RHS repeat-associated core domain-containing protein, partial [Polyangium sp.]|nr:RHS repeat-associated core domain-containing protein [Polyangium sp.]